ncbi:MAG: helix-turn-helix domain-containing protein [bacterium]|nr:helix-turn-helix domain-containing protein [bacterium]
MTGKRHSAGGEALTELVLAIFRLNGRLLAAGDRLVGDLGLSSARWQVLGAIALAASPQPVAWLARSMGLNRQGVQRIVNEMRDDGLVELRPNPHHLRAHLVTLTRKGQGAFAVATELQVPWVNALARGIAVNDLAAASRIVRLLGERLDQAE